MNTTITPRSLLSNRTVGGSASARATIDGRQYINFFGSQYLALTSEPEIRGAVIRALESGVPFAQQFPTALGGVEPIFAAVEHAGSVACGTEASVYFASGYLIGAVGFWSLASLFELIVLDEGAHLSLNDAAKLTGVPSFTFAHCDAESLGDALKTHAGSGKRPLVVTDGVFATTGSVPPLDDYAGLLAGYGGRLFVDESHAFGVVGVNGRGASEYCGVEHIATIGSTLSKAYCAQGALVGCSTDTAARLRMAPPIRGACAGSPLSAVAATASLNYVARHPHLRTEIRALADYLRRRLRETGMEVIDSPAPIVSFKYGDRNDMQQLQRRAFDCGIFIYYSTYLGAGPEGMIRCAVFRDHTRADIDALIATLV